MDDEEVLFEDKNLELVIRKDINRPLGPILEGDLKEITDLLANDREIKNLKGLEYLINLTSLDLDHNQISDISALRSGIHKSRGDIF